MMTALCNPDAVAAVIVSDIAPKPYRMNPQGEIPNIVGCLACRAVRISLLS